MEKSRDELIHEKGFDMIGHNYYMPYAAPGEQDYRKIKVGLKTLEDAVLNLGSLKDKRVSVLADAAFLDKNVIYKALFSNNLEEQRAISNFYYNINGIYKRACDYIAFLYRYDWYIEPEIYDDDLFEEGKKHDKVMERFNHVLNFLDASDIKRTCGEIALKVALNGCYYGYIVPCSDQLVLQELPVKYCRSLYSAKGRPAVEFNMKFFDTFKDPVYRLKVLDLFPEEFKKGYMAYLKGKLVAKEGDYWKNEDGWYLLDIENTVKFNFNGSDRPIFIDVIPALLDLDEAQALDRRKQMQKLLKIIVQKLPRDKNGDLIFDVDEATDLHNNVVEMLEHTVGTDVLTTFADIEAIDMSDKNTATTSDDLQKVERAIFNNLGISQNMFNTDGNMSLEKSILNDESLVRNLLLQFTDFYDRITEAFTTDKKRYKFKFYMLETTQYNYKELSKMYKEQTQIGFSKMLPQIALGHSQSFIVNTAKFENQFLNLNAIMIPPLMSSVMSGEDVLGTNLQNANTKSQSKIDNTTQQSDSNSAGRPEKPDDQKSDKTIANKESMS